jgi:hypothetical protein
MLETKEKINENDRLCNNIFITYFMAFCVIMHQAFNLNSKSLLSNNVSRAKFTRNVSFLVVLRLIRAFQQALAVLKSRILTSKLNPA